MRQENGSAYREQVKPEALLWRCLTTALAERVNAPAETAHEVQANSTGCP